MIDQKHLDFWVRNNRNVSFEGHAGVGKTAIVIGTFQRHSLNYRVFSGATMDPWVDLIGVPKHVVDPVTGESYIEVITPRSIDFENIEAIFIDEINRAPKKVQNALLEMIQFKTINGKSLPKLRIVWAAMNPEESDGRSYNVYKSDEALVDRFHVHAKIPFRCDLSYFSLKYGAEVANVAIEWWNALTDKNRFKVSPRRLDYALEIYQLGGDLGFVLPEEVVYRDLVTNLSGIGFTAEVQKAIDDGVLSDFLLVSDNSIKVSKMFERFGAAVQDSIVADMTEEFIMTAGNTPSFTSNKNFTSRYRDVLEKRYANRREDNDENWDREQRLREALRRAGVPLDAIASSPQLALASEESQNSGVHLSLVDAKTRRETPEKFLGPVMPPYGEQVALFMTQTLRLAYRTNFKEYFNYGDQNTPTPLGNNTWDSLGRELQCFTDQNGGFAMYGVVKDAASYSNYSGVQRAAMGFKTSLEYWSQEPNSYSRLAYWDGNVQTCGAYPMLREDLFPALFFIEKGVKRIQIGSLSKYSRCGFSIGLMVTKVLNTILLHATDTNGRSVTHAGLMHYIRKNCPQMWKKIIMNPSVNTHIHLIPQI